MGHDEFKCDFLGQCGGCSSGNLSYGEQAREKIQRTMTNFPGVVPEFHSLGVKGIRDRGDFIISNNQFCLYSIAKTSGVRELIPIQECPQLTEDAQIIFKELQKLHWPVKKGSIRFRASPVTEYKAGLWLDFSNQDIKSLLDSGSLLNELLERSFYIEVGQKKKRVVKLGNQLKLAEVEYHPWSKTYYEDKEILLYSTVSSFTQTGLQANRKFSALLQEELHQLQSQSLIEFGSGIGTLTFPALSEGRKVHCCEFEATALEGLKKTISIYDRLYTFSERISLSVGNFHKKQDRDFFRNYDTILLNPPRSGIGDFLISIAGETENDSQDSGLYYKQLKWPDHILYLSCFMDSMKKDSLVLEKMGYQLKKMHIIDQFPQSPHCENLGVWTRNY